MVKANTCESLTGTGNQAAYAAIYYNIDRNRSLARVNKL